MWNGLESPPTPPTYLDKQTRENRDTRDTVHAGTEESARAEMEPTFTSYIGHS